MKKILSGLLALALTLTAVIVPVGDKISTITEKTSVVANAQDSNIVTANFVGKYQQSSARAMLSLINDFRTGNNAWQWNEDNTTKTTFTNLKAINYDYELEKVAIQRAVELVSLFSHTRPNGETCFTAYTDTYNNTYKGENIAIGTSNLDTQSAFDLWKEENEPYDRQGHRRNMLSSNFTSIGIAHVYYNGCHYWVQELSSKVGSSTETIANDSDTKMSMEISAANVNNPTLNLEYTTKEIESKANVALPKVTCTMKSASQWQYAPALTFDVTPTWSVSSGNDIVKITDAGNIQGIKAGKAELTADCGILGTKKVSITVTAKNELEGVIYYQTNTKDQSQIRFVAELSVEDVEKANSGNYTIEIGDAQISEEILTAYRSIRVNGELLKATDGKCFIVTPTIDSIIKGTKITSTFDLDTYDVGLSRTIVL